MVLDFTEDTSNLILPFSVYLIELDNIFNMICLILSESPNSTSGMSFSIFVSNDIWVFFYLDGIMVLKSSIVSYIL